MSGSRWSDLGRRSLSAAVLAPLPLLGVAVGGALYDGLIGLGALALALEWVALCRARATSGAGIWVPVGVVLAGVAAALLAPLAGLAAACAGTIACRLSGGGSLLAAGSLYLGVPNVALIWLRGTTHGREIVLFLLLVVWATDVGAYAVGRTLRGRLLAPAISPGKTWSGAVGGLLAACLVGWLAGLSTGLPSVWVALPLAIAAQAGDLLESGIKRHVGVKDSGRWIPGHGGLLDRLDGLLAAAPLAALAALVGWGGV